MSSLNLGFRAGTLPPYVMPDVRKYIVSYGLETIFGQLCNINGLEMCSEDGDKVAFGQDAYYADIIMPDFRGYSFEKQRDSWREGTDFSFLAEFVAKEDRAKSDDNVVKAMDTEIVSSE
jgi:hypothetical protein